MTTEALSFADLYRPDADADPHLWLQEALDAVAGLGRALATEMQQGGTPTDVFNVSRPAIRRLADFETLGFLSLSDDGLTFELRSVDPPDAWDLLQAEVDHQIREGTFGWSIYQGRPVIVPGRHLGPWVLLHVMATPRRTLGMFVGSLVEASVFVPDICQKALSILLLNSASVMESALLHLELDAHNRNLEVRIRERTEELRRSEAAARAASRAKSDFLANMSHEIRTPINGIMGMNSLMMDGALDFEQRAQAETIQRSAESLLTIINEILDFSKIEAGRLTLEQVPFDLKSVVEDVADLLASRATEKGLELTVTCDADVPRHVLGDPGRLRQVLTNLVGNAVKFTDRGEIVVDVALRPLAGGEGTFVVSVHDTGIGIEPAKLERVFEKFTQADTSTTRVYGGTGLGLSISRELIRLMGGTLSVRSVPGEGSTFWFTLPFVPDPDAPPPPARSLEGKRFLVVAENGHVVDSIRQPLRRRGGHVVWLSDPTAVEAIPAGTAFTAAFVDWGRGEAAVGLVPERVDPGGRSGTRFHLLVPVTRRQDPAVLSVAGYDGVLARPVRESRLATVLAPGGESSVSAAVDGRPGPGGALPEARRAPRVLLAEDDPVNRAVATGMLRRLECEVEVVENGAEALAAVAAAPAERRFDLVIMDCQMPVMDGYEATRRIREREGPDAPRLPILALSASVLASDRERGIEAGMDDYLTKPIRLDDVRAILDGWVPRTEGTTPPVAPVGPATFAAAYRGRPLDLEAALRQVGGDRALLMAVAGIFLDGWSELKGRLGAACAEGDATGAHHLAHRIKGGAGNVGATVVHALASDLEARARTGDMDEAAAMADAIDRAMEAYRSALQQVREESEG